jgi:hypothetical protein
MVGGALAGHKYKTWGPRALLVIAPDASGARSTNTRHQSNTTSASITDFDSEAVLHPKFGSRPALLAMRPQ